MFASWQYSLPCLLLRLHSFRSVLEEMQGKQHTHADCDDTKSEWSSSSKLHHNTINLQKTYLRLRDFPQELATPAHIYLDKYKVCTILLPHGL